MPTLFISHSSADRTFIERHLIPVLNANGLRTWYSKEQIPSGAHWERAIRDGLEASQWFVVVVSPNAVASEWVRAEVDWAVENRWGQIVPVLIGDADPSDLHLRLRLVQNVDWRTPDRDAKDRLLAVWGIASSGEAFSAEPPGPQVRFDDYLFPRPQHWYCVFCGWECDEDFNEYLCKRCGSLRPFTGGSSTMVQCRTCEGWSLSVASFCEWCGASVSS